MSSLHQLQNRLAVEIAELFWDWLKDKTNWAVELERQLRKTTLGITQILCPHQKIQLQMQIKSKKQLLKMSSLHQLQNRLVVEIAELFCDWLKDEKMDSYVFGSGSNIWILLESLQ